MRNAESYEFYSINRPNGSDFSKQLELHINCYNEDSIEIVLTNLKYPRQRAFKLKQIFGLVCCFILYKALATTHRSSKNTATFERSVIIDSGFIIILIYLIFSTTRLIISEKLLLCLDFALQLETQRFLSRMSSVLIPYSNIHDVCINEVIENLDIHYILIIRTRGDLFNKKQIVPIFNTLKPSIDCLEVVYNHLTVIINKNRH